MESLKSVAPVRPVAAYLGGKRNLAARITAQIEATPHSAYAEAFIGMGGIFFRRRMRPASEAINDISGDVATLFRILQRHYQAFMDMLKWQLTSRAEFDRLLRLDPEALTDLERAARFLYLQRITFGGKVTARSFGVSAGLPARFDVTKLGTLLADVHDRLAGVTIERLHYADFISRYDSAGMLFYLDPPYWAGEGDYGPGVFSQADFVRLADQLAGARASFILSINDTPEIRAIFADFEMEPVTTTYTISGEGSTEARELIITRLPAPITRQETML